MEPLKTAAAVGDYYDTVADVNAALGFGTVMHRGYFDGPDDPCPLPEAADRLTRLAGEQLHLAPGRRLLDIGCGSGGPALLLARESGCSVVGLNVGERQIHTARRAATQAQLDDRVEFVTGDAADLPFPDDTFDAAMLLEMASHLDPTAKTLALSHAARCLRPGGRLVLTDFVQTPEAPGTLDHLVPGTHFLTADRTTALVAATPGLRVEHTRDLTARTRYSSPRALAALTERRRELTASWGADTYAGLEQIMRNMTAHADHFGYIMITAEKTG